MAHHKCEMEFEGCGGSTGMMFEMASFRRHGDNKLRWTCSNCWVYMTTGKVVNAKALVMQSGKDEPKEQVDDGLEGMF